ncbi:MAG: zinc-ribbon domain-containing protein [Elusimicrobiota bacterium]
MGSIICVGFLAVGLLSGCAGIQEEFSWFGKQEVYQEPQNGVVMTIKNKMSYKTLFGGVKKVKIAGIRIDGMNVQSVDAKFPILFGEEKRIKITPGSHRITFFLSDNYKYSAEDYDIDDDIVFEFTCPLPGIYRISTYTPVKKKKLEYDNEVIYCPQCGSKNPKNARFCDKCGAKLK